MPITRTPMIDDDGSGTTGTIINNAWKTEFYNQIDAVAGGAWTARAFNAANYYPEPPLTWTPIAAQIYLDRYTYLGNLLIWHVKMSDITLGGAPGAHIHVKLPGSRLVPIASQLIGVDGYTNAGWSVHRIYVAAGSTDCWIRRLDLNAISPGAMSLEWTATFEVNP